MGARGAFVIFRAAQRGNAGAVQACVVIGLSPAWCEQHAAGCPAASSYRLHTCVAGQSTGDITRFNTAALLPLQR